MAFSIGWRHATSWSQLADGATPGFHFIDMSYSHVFPQGIAGTRMATFDLQDLMFQIKHSFPAQRNGPARGYRPPASAA